MVDQAKLDQMLANLRRYLSVLGDLGRAEHREFLANPDQIGNAKYHFVIAIECAIDIANHIIASENYRFPKDNADSFNVLVEHSVLGGDRLDALRAMARFRNRLVHLYWDVENDRVYEFLQTALGRSRRVRARGRRARLVTRGSHALTLRADRWHSRRRLSIVRHEAPRSSAW